MSEPRPPESESKTTPTESLLPSLDTEQHTRVDDFLYTSHPQEIGPYRILEPIGQGGMGVVYKAEQRQPVKRIVALKLIKLGMDTRDVIARFESERQALAMMNHPNVARVFDAGATDTGRPYFVMEHVAGLSITAFSDRHQLPITQRLELFIQACEAVQHAHQKAIIHRDLKPSNILVTADDSAGLAGQVKVIDFGVAKAIAQKLTERTLFTEAGKLIGTPEYMSPEQAEMSALDVDTRSDIYSLGVVLYELLAGALPFDPRTLRSAGLAEIQRIIRDVDPPRLSTRVSGLGPDATEVARKRATQPATLHRQLRGELEWIPLKAMRKERGHRYATAAELAADIRNYLEHRPLQAGPPSARYRLGKFLRRNRGAVAASMAMLFLLIAGISTTTWQAIRATDQKQQAQDRQREAEAVLQFVTNDVLGRATPERLPDKAVRDTIVRAVLDPGAKAIEGAFEDRPLVEASVRATVARCYRTLGRPDLALPHAIQSLELRRRALGEDDVLTFQAIDLLAGIHIENGELIEAERLWRDAIPRCERAYGESHDMTIHLHGSLGNLLLVQSRYAEAAPLLRRAVEHRRQQGKNPRELILTMQNLAQAIWEMGQEDETEALFRESYERSRRDLGERDTATINCLNSLASLLHRRGKLEEAEPPMRDALSASRAVLGDDHMTTLVIISNLARLQQGRGQLAEAEALYREAVATLQRAYGADHPNTLMAKHNLGMLLDRQRRLTEAEPVLREALEGRRRALPADHVHTMHTLMALAVVTAAQGRDSEAETLYAELYQRCPQTQLRPEEAARFMAGWGPCLVRLGRYEQAEAPLLEARRRLSETGQGQSGTMRRVLSALAELFERTGRADQAVQWRNELAELPPPPTRPSTRPVTRATAPPGG